MANFFHLPHSSHLTDSLAGIKDNTATKEKPLKVNEADTQCDEGNGVDSLSICLLFTFIQILIELSSVSLQRLQRGEIKRDRTLPPFHI